MITTGITLADIETDSIFTLDGQCYQKGSMGTGASDGGYTICYPKRGGKFQHGKKFKTKIPNNSQILI